MKNPLVRYFAICESMRRHFRAEISFYPRHLYVHSGKKRGAPDVWRTSRMFLGVEPFAVVANILVVGLVFLLALAAGFFFAFRGACVLFLFNVDFVAFEVENSIFEVGERLVRNNLEAEAVFLAPTQVIGN